jgi:hypothetical protein
MIRALSKLALAASTVSALLAVSQCPATAARVPPHSPAAVGLPRHSRAAAPAPVPREGAVNSTKIATPETDPYPVRRTSCSPIAEGDHVHISSTGPPTASGHGWWKRGNCTAAKAQVSIVLQEHFSDGSWRDRGQGGQGDFPPGPGAGKRATARAVCLTTNLTGWRSVVNVSVINESGTASVTTPGVNINCRVP